MYKTLNIAVLLVCFAAALAGIQTESYFLRPSFDPSPKSALSSSSRATDMNSIQYQDYDDGWVNYAGMTAEYNDLGQICCIYNQVWNAQNSQWETSSRALIDYRPDGRPLHAVLANPEGDNWTTFGEVHYWYADNRLQAVRYERLVDGVFQPFWQLHCSYAPNTNILESVLEISYFWGSLTPYLRKFDYTWDAASRPAVIVESTMGRKWVQSTRHNYVYHNDDQTTHASYMRTLEFGFPIFDRFVTGVLPSMLLEDRTYHAAPDGSVWYERYQDIYHYGDENRLDMIETYEISYQQDWRLSREKHYAYVGSIPVRETGLELDFDQGILIPSFRIKMGYDGITPADDPVIPAVIGGLGVYPNPFNPTAGISYKLEAAGQAEISVYNLKGQKVRTLLNANKASGTHQLTWDGKDDRGTDLAAGIYLIRLRTGSQTKTVKAVLAK